MVRFLCEEDMGQGGAGGFAMLLMHLGDKGRTYGIKVYHMCEKYC
jgi:hypothetical protein